jgi:hypothetical protein
MAGLVIDWVALEAAFESHDPAHRAWFDAATGAIIVSAAAPGPRAVRIEAIPSREQYRIMERFIATVTAPALKDALNDAIVGKGAFRRFKDAVSRFPDERKRWFAFRDALVHRHILDWLKLHKVELQEIPAWNLEPPMVPTPPSELMLSESMSSTPSSEGAPVADPRSEPRAERAEVEQLKSWVQAWARSHGEEYRYLFGPASFDRLVEDLGHEFLVTRKPRSPT